MPTTTELKAAILTWARNKGVLIDAANVPGGDLALIPFSDDMAEFFRTRKIIRVVDNPLNNKDLQVEIRIYTRQKLADFKITRLQVAFAKRFSQDGFLLALDVSAQFQVSPRGSPFGPEGPILRTSSNIICCGSSLGLGNQRNAGTLTALARKKDDKSGLLYGLSCNHVTGGCSTARPGTPIVVPGIMDVSTDHAEITIIGRHEAAASMSQGLPSVFDIKTNRDLAYFTIGDSNLVSSQQGVGENAYDTPKLPGAKPTLGMPVKKWGRSTGFTEGSLALINTEAEPIPYSLTSYYGPTSSQEFKGTIYYNRLFEVKGRAGRAFSSGGDSGALVVTNYPNKPEKVVGMIIAGNKDRSLLLPLGPALKFKDFAFELVSGHQVDT